MANQTVHLHEKYSKKLDQAFTLGSVVKGRLNKEEEFVGARTVRISNINTVPLGDYNRGATANRYGTPTEVGDTVQELTMSQDKSFSAVIRQCICMKNIRKSWIRRLPLAAWSKGV